MIVWSRINKDKLNPLFAIAVENIFGALPDVWYATYGWRSREEQAALYRAYVSGGAKAAPPGFSPHEWGLAIDVALDKEAQRQGLQPSWDLNDPRWERMIHAVMASKWLHSGVSFGDGGHVELVDWKHRAKR